MNIFDKSGNYFIKYHNGNLQFKNTKTLISSTGPLLTDVTCFCILEAVTFQLGSNEGSNVNEFLAIGTATGLMLIYSINKNEIELQIRDKSLKSIMHVCFDNEVGLFSASKNEIVHWDLKQKVISNRWEAGNERLTKILLFGKRNLILSASHAIKLWDIKTKDLIRIFFTSSSTISILNKIESTNGDYFICGAKDTRILSCWSLENEQSAYVNLSTEEVPNSVSIFSSDEHKYQIAVVTQSGLLQIFEINLSSEYKKPIEGVLIVQFVNEVLDNNNQSIIVNVPIQNSFWLNELSVLLAYGTDMFTNCEIILLDFSKKIQFYIRDVKAITKNHYAESKKEKTPKIIQNQVEYVADDRKRALTDFKPIISMEKRLDNLLVESSSNKKTLPSIDSSLSQLLIQALRNRNKKMLKHVLTSTTSHDVIQNTIKNLSYECVLMFLEQITQFFTSKPNIAMAAVDWCKICISYHGIRLKTHSEIKYIFSKVIGLLMNRVKYSDKVHSLSTMYEYAVNNSFKSSLCESIDLENQHTTVIYDDNSDSNESNDEHTKMDIDQDNVSND